MGRVPTDMQKPDERDYVLRDHPNLASTLHRLKHRAAEFVTDEFLARHPDWLLRYGETARSHGIEDACCHLDFLAGAIEGQSTTSFAHYAQRTTRVLESRGIDPRFMAENLDQLEMALLPHLTKEEGAVITSILSAGRAMCILAPAPVPVTEFLAGLQGSQRLFLHTLLAGRREEALQIVLEVLRSGQAITDVYVEIVQESLYEVGRLWETNRITVAEEHMATAIIQYVLARVYAQRTPAVTSYGNIVITGIPGELHQVGANLVADMLEAGGWDVRFLGTNVPHAGILKVIETHHADILGISATMLFSVPQVKGLMVAVRARFGPHGPRIVLGGGVFRQLPNLAADLGADGSAMDVRGVSALMQAVLGASPRA